MLAADIAAVDRGEPLVMAVLYRGTLPGYPRWFRRKMVVLQPDELVFRPFWSSPLRTRRRLRRADIVAAAPGADRASPLYQPGARMASYASFDVLRCQLAGGTLDLAVPRPDVPLMLHYLNRVAGGVRPEVDS